MVEPAGALETPGEAGRRRVRNRSEPGHRDRGWPTASALIGTILLLAVFWRVYQGLFAWSKGLDASRPEFQKYWITLLVVQLVLLAAGSSTWWAWLLKRPCTTCRRQIEQHGGVDPRHEEMHIKILWGIVGAWCLGFFLMAGFFGEQDAAWHQVAVRDTAFTPSHIILFYGSFPLLIVFSVGGLLYARTRIPSLYGDRRLPLSFVLVIAGGILLMFEVALNEYAHSVFQTEERFAAPLHWPFVFYGYLTAATFAIWLETVDRVIELRSDGRDHPQRTAA